MEANDGPLRNTCNPQEALCVYACYYVYVCMCSLGPERLLSNIKNGPSLIRIASGRDPAQWLIHGTATAVTTMALQTTQHV